MTVSCVPWACNNRPMSMSLHVDLAAVDPILVPRPLRVVRHAGVTSRVPAVEVQRDGTLKKGAYRLLVKDGSSPTALIVCADAEGERNGRATLVQLCTQYGDQLPVLEVEDEPVFAVRGVMLDISRDRVPSMEQMLRTVDLLASLKYNHLELYTEHVFAYKGHEEVWSGWSPMTADEIREIDAYCTKLGIELVANQNCFGHLGKWLKLPKYRDLAETHGDWMFDGAWPMSGAFSLCPTDPRSIELVRDMLTQLMPCFKSPLVNIGCDETFDIEFGRSKDACKQRGRETVYTDFVRQICEIVTRSGRRPMFWADIALSHPECLQTLPTELVSLAWGYEPDAPFEKWCEAGRAGGREVWVCPGTSTWRTITGRSTERRENLRAAALGGVAGGAAGILVTDWGDTGHHQQWPVTAHGLAQGAEAAWSGCRAGKGDLDVTDATSLHVHSDRTLRAGRWLEELGDADLVLRETCGQLSRPDRTRLRNQTALFIDLLKKHAEQTDVGSVEDWEATSKRLKELAARVPTGMGDLVDAEFAHTIRFAQIAADRGAWRRKQGGLTAQERQNLRERLEGVMAEHRRTWLARSRAGGLEASCGHLTGMINDLA